LKIDSLKEIVRYGIGSMFIIAAILKLISIDEFELYIYSFDILNFLLTTLFSRLLIAGELVLGLLLVFKMCYKFTWRATLSVQIVFTLFLAYVLVFRNDSNCHCFGELVELSPLESIIKNIVVIGGLFFIKTQRRRDAETQSKFVKKILLVAAVIIPFVVTPMDSVYKMIYSSEKEISTVDFYQTLDKVVKMDFVDNDIVFDSTAQIKMDGKQMVVIVSSGCKYCRLGVKKLSMMMRKNDIKSDNVKIFIWGSREGILNFKDETLTDDFSYWHIMPHEAVDITLGRFPTFIILEEKEIVNISDFRDIDESFFSEL
jgi:thioredoxin-related protein